MLEYKGWQRVSDERYEAEISTELGDAGRIFVSKKFYGRWWVEGFGIVKGSSDTPDDAKIAARHLATERLETALDQGNRLGSREYPEDVLRAALAQVAQLEP
jgi:hypothetical protein